MFPQVVKLVKLITQLNFLHAGLLTAALSSLGASLMLAIITWKEFQDRFISLWTVLLFNIYPLAYFQLAPYSEGLYFLLVTLFFYFLRFGNSYLVPALCCTLAIATRLMGATLIPVLLFKILLDYRANKSRLYHLGVLIVPALSILGYFWLNHAVWGNPLFFLQRTYTDPYTPRYPIFPLLETISSLFTLFKLSINWELSKGFMETLGWGALFTTAALLLSVYSIYKRTIPWEYNVYSICYLLFYSSFHWGISNARYSYGAIPIFIVIARSRNKNLLCAVSLFAILLLLYFANLYIQGYWAF